MVQFTKLRLAGFKSFVDPTELEIGPGMTGIVGPNGCGKSNLVEALRWAMGETSSKRMRGSGMEDVIFNGTATRPARNMAEVVLTLDNADRKAPAHLNDDDTLEIVRRIDRGEGSSYKVNGKPVRARDVQLLFADSAIGANSPALVSQGHITAMISAKPQQRRLVLEEAAGISGLHARRHEAELKLRAAENNLTRVEDVIGQMNIQFESLKKQARQASRYRNLSGHIQRAEAILLHQKLANAQQELEKARLAFEQAEEVVRAQTVIVTRETTRQTEQAAGLPELRQAEAEAAAALQRLNIALENLASEEEKAARAAEETRRNLQQVAADIAHENSNSAEADQATQRLEQEAEEIHQSAQNHEEDLAQAQTARDSMAENVRTLDGVVNTQTEEVAITEARRNSLSGRASELEQKLTTLRSRLEDLQQQYDTLLETSAATEEQRAAAEAVTSAEDQFEKSQAALEMAEAAKNAAEAVVSQAQQEQQTRQGTWTKLNAESQALQNLLAAAESGDYEPVIDALRVEAGLETALAVALGDDLQAALDSGAPVFWREMPELEAADLPYGAEPISRFVEAPAALRRSLSQIGVVADEDTGARLAAQLQPGQCLVTRDGAAWRWDGLTVAARAPSAAAARLQQRNRLQEISIEIESAQAALDEAQAQLTHARDERDAAEDLRQQARDDVRNANNAVSAARSEQNRVTQRTQEVSRRLTALSESITSGRQNIEEMTAQLEIVREDLSALPDVAQMRETLNARREELSALRTELTTLQSQLDQIVREAQARDNRLQAIASEIQSWATRRERAQTRRAELTARTEILNDTLVDLEQRPRQIEVERQTLLTRIEEADGNRSAAADRLAEAENALREIQTELKTAESTLADARELRAHAQAGVAAAQKDSDELTAQITEKFECTPDQLLAKVEITADEELPDAESIETKLQRLLRERENMGPVNLRAEAESQELETKMAEMTKERDDLVEAINRLRQGIAKLNREARERLLAAFDVVDSHFQSLFTRLFGGGKAHLALTEAEDPLEAGLEIFAQPPGKKLQVMSLLSGGEQTLTSTALIFAMFLTNPAPICVLDEIDAPLDDSNVDRVCTLVEEIARSTSTRFVLVTHHRMTMARMDRLYGVTMTERGVSRLVSVDLRQKDMFTSAEETVAAAVA